MNPELRYDRGLAEPIKSEDGFFRARVTIARTGVFPYLTSSGDIRMEAKLPEDLLSEMTVDSAKGAPISDGHPPVTDNRGMINSENWAKYTRGSLGDSAIVHDDRLEFVETIYDAALISDLEAGRKVEVSVGFHVDMDYTPGEYEGVRYDARQRNIRINHVAHVNAGRAGEDIRVHLDSKDENFAVMQYKTTTRRDSLMGKFWEGLKKLFEEFKVTIPDEPDVNTDSDDEEKKDEDEEDNDTATKSESKQDSATIKQLRKTVKTQAARIDALEAMTAKQKAARSKAEQESRIDEAVDKRLSLIETAKSVISEFKHDGLSDRAIKLAVIEKILPYSKEVKTDSLEDVFIDARFDAAMSLAKEKAEINPAGVPDSRLDEAAIATKKAQRLNVMEAK